MTEKHGRLLSMGLPRVIHDWACTQTHTPKLQNVIQTDFQNISLHDHNHPSNLVSWVLLSSSFREETEWSDELTTILHLTVYWVCLIFSPHNGNYSGTWSEDNAERSWEAARWEFQPWLCLSWSSGQVIFPLCLSLLLCKIGIIIPHELFVLNEKQ